MGFLDSLLTRRIDTERSWLKELRTATESWYNQLTEPLLPLLSGQINPESPDAQEEYAEIAYKLLQEAMLVNAGNAINNIFAEMGERGLPMITSRERLTPLIQKYIESGHFLKRIAYNFNRERARSEWIEFQMAKDRLVREINDQLRRIG